MYIIYLTSACGKKIENYKTVVRIELMGHKISRNKICRFKNYGYEQAKLIAVTDFLNQVAPRLNHKKGTGLTICLDSHELFFDSKFASKNQFSETTFPEEWQKLMETINKLSVTVSFKKSGILSMSMRDELRQEIEDLQTKCVTVTF